MSNSELEADLRRLKGIAEKAVAMQDVLRRDLVNAENRAARLSELVERIALVKPTSPYSAIAEIY